MPKLILPSLMFVKKEASEKVRLLVEEEPEMKRGRARD